MLVEVQKQVVWATWLRQFDLVQLNCYLGAKVDTKVTKARTDDLDQLNWYLRARRAVHLQLLAIAGGALQRQEWKLTMKWTWQIMCSSSSEEILRKASGHSVDRKGNLRNWKFSQRRNSHGAPQNSSCQLLTDSWIVKLTRYCHLELDRILEYYYLIPPGNFIIPPLDKFHPKGQKIVFGYWVWLKKGS